MCKGNDQGAYPDPHTLVQRLAPGKGCYCKNLCLSGLWKLSIPAAPLPRVDPWGQPASPSKSCTGMADWRSLCHTPVSLLQKLPGKKVLSLYHKVEKSPNKKGYAKEQSGQKECPLHLLKQILGIRFNASRAPIQGFFYFSPLPRFTSTSTHVFYVL